MLFIYYLGVKGNWWSPVSGAAVRTTCAFDPPNPKADTPVSRTCYLSSFGHGSVYLKNLNFRVCSSIALLTLRSYAIPGIVHVWIVSAVLIKPVIPAAVSKWPTLDLTAETNKGLFAALFRPKRTIDSAPDSIVSPKAVPVPWASTNWIYYGLIYPSVRAFLIIASYALVFGVVKQLLLPS